MEIFALTLLILCAAGVAAIFWAGVKPGTFSGGDNLSTDADAGIDYSHHGSSISDAKDRRSA